MTNKKKNMANDENNISQEEEIKGCAVAYPCTQAEHIGEMMGLLKNLVKQVYGNGQKGLAFTVPEQTVRIDNLAGEIRNLATNVSALMKYMNETNGGEVTKEKIRLSGRAWAGIVVSAIIGFTIIAITLLQVYMRLHKMI